VWAQGGRGLRGGVQGRARIACAGFVDHPDDVGVVGGVAHRACGAAGGGPIGQQRLHLQWRTAAVGERL